jgi:hypothetical protein
MKAIFLLLILFTFNSCLKNSGEKAAEIKVLDKKVGSENQTRSIVEKYPVGDINNDEKPDMATIGYNYSYLTDQVRTNDHNGFIDIAFSAGIPDLRINNTLDVFTKPTPDLNNDGANEILVFSRFESNWNNILVYSFSVGSWKKLAEAKCLYDDYRDLTDRIIKEEGNFYLLGDSGDESKGELEKRVVKIKIVSN